MNSQNRHGMGKKFLNTLDDLLRLFWTLKIIWLPILFTVWLYDYFSSNNIEPLYSLFGGVLLFALLLVHPVITERYG
jgi:hypothetical protein